MNTQKSSNEFPRCVRCGEVIGAYVPFEFTPDGRVHTECPPSYEERLHLLDTKLNICYSKKSRYMNRILEIDDDILEILAQKTWVIQKHQKESLK